MSTRVKMVESAGEQEQLLRLKVEHFPHAGELAYSSCHLLLPVKPHVPYPGLVDKRGMALDRRDYHKWEKSLPHEWVTRPYAAWFIFVPQTIRLDQLSELLIRHDSVITNHQNDLRNNHRAIQNHLDGVLEEMGFGSSLKERNANKRQRAIRSNHELLNFQSDFLFGGAIDIGSRAAASSYAWSGGSTRLDLGNAANDTGVLTWFECRTYSAENIYNVKVGTWYFVSGTTYRDRDFDSLGTIGGNPYSVGGLSIDVTASDLLGAFWNFDADDRIYCDDTGGAGVLYVAGDKFDAANTNFTSYDAGDNFSIYATGATIPINYSESASVIVGVLPAASRVAAFDRNSSVLIGVLAAASRAATFIRASSVIVGNLVSATKTVQWVPVSASVIVGIAASATKTVQWAAVSASVIVGIVVTATKTAAFTRSASSLIGCTVSASRAATLTRASSVIIGNLVTATRTVAFTRTASTIVGVVAVGVRVFAATRSAAVIIGVAVSATAKKFLVLPARFFVQIAYQYKVKVELRGLFKLKVRLVPRYRTKVELR